MVRQCRSGRHLPTVDLNANAKQKGTFGHGDSTQLKDTTKSIDLIRLS